ncbi:hypothetical protein UFOVP16_21 [uncultured Caudovirales phage]|uniref:Uncharacterized protein n=1 Tax=uncultured Caudovirales phage TaxID=2100421 RepID=A0A6J5KL94_9CAUD|nr:hypothetical protein UFOVP16_21 [uncultured Caudovirales phage]
MSDNALVMAFLLAWQGVVWLGVGLAIGWWLWAQ